MNFLGEFKDEITSQMIILTYIESRFILEFKNSCNLLNIDSNRHCEIFTNNKQFVELIRSKYQATIVEVQAFTPQYKCFPDWLKRIDMREPLGELINMAVECAGEETKESVKNKIEEAILQSKDMAKAGEIDLDEDYCNFTSKEIEKAIDAAFIIMNNNECDKNEEKKDALYKLNATVELLDNFSSSNIYRQSFICVFSLFDAFIFDVLKNFFQKKPFEMEIFFKNNGGSEKSKMPYEDILAFSDMTTLINEMVERKFDGKYLSTLVKLLKSYNENVFKDSDYAKLIEAINRRNIHLHNKGKVDKKYLNIGPTGETAFNIFNLDLGSFAYIDKNYLLEIVDILLKFSNNLLSTYN